eukprot:SAG31_NODE_958_length_10763_cov_8.374531_9_plen_134_part_00
MPLPTRLTRPRCHRRRIGFRTRGATFPVPKGGTKEAFVIAFLIERKSEYYFWKAVLPLSLVMFFSCGINIFPVEDLPNRMTMATTMFLAAFATLYTVQQELPKTCGRPRLSSPQSAGELLKCLLVCDRAAGIF